MRTMVVMALLAFGCSDPATKSFFPDCPPGQFSTIMDDRTTDPPTHKAMCLHPDEVAELFGS